MGFGVQGALGAGLFWDWIYLGWVGLDYCFLLLLPAWGGKKQTASAPALQGRVSIFLILFQ
jgi:hypothetical protein